MLFIRTLAAICAVLTAQACSSIERHPTRTMSKNESRSLPQSVATDRALNQLADILIAMPAGESGVRPKRPLEDLWYWTIPRATNSPGICQTDRVILMFEHAMAPDADADTPARVNGISAEPRFHVLPNADRANRDWLSEAQQADLDKRCKLLRPNDIDLVSASDDGLVLRGIRVFDAMQSHLQLPHPRLILECHPNDSTCREEFDALTFVDVHSIESCEVNRTYENAGCMRFTTADFTVSVYAAHTGTPPRVFEVSAERRLVLWHRRID
jgi:hypothetical protein